MKKLTVFSLHLGYGGIESAIASLVNSIADDYEINIVSVYKLYDENVLDLDKRIKVDYLINNDIAIRVDTFKKDIKSLKFIKLIKDLFKEYKINIFRFFKDIFTSIKIVIKKKSLLKKYIKKMDTDIAITTRYEHNKFLGKYAKKGIYKIAWEHNHHHNNFKYAKKVTKSCKNIDTLVLVSSSLRDFYDEQMKEYNYKCRCVYIPNMIDNIPSISSKLDNLNFVSVGRLSKEKGYADLIEVINIYKEKNPNTKFHLDIIGDGTEKNKIVDLIEKYKLNNYIKLHGYLKKDKINQILSKSSLYLMTSFTESFGIVLIEAMSFGIPCIAFNSAEGANDLIINNYNGYLIEDRDYNKMVEKIELIMNNKEKRIKFGKNAKSSCLKYSSKNVSKEWNNLLNKTSS